MMELSGISDRLRPGLVLITSLVCAFAAPSAARGQPAYLEVSKTDAGFTVEAEQATLPQVLSAIGAKAGFAVQDSGAERPAIPLFEVRDATLESTLRQLLGTSNHVIVYRGGAGAPIADGNVEKIILLSPGKRERVADRPTSSLAGPPSTIRSPPTRGSIAPPPPPPSVEAATDTPRDPADQAEQEEYGEVLQEMEHEVIDQLTVDPQQVAGMEPGVAPAGLPPDVLQRLEEYAEGNGAMPPPETIAPADH